MLLECRTRFRYPHHDALPLRRTRRAAEAHLTGGEPFLIDVCYRIWVQTNGTRFDRRVQEVLRRGKVGLNISIDSLRKRTFAQIRSPARFDVVRRNLDRFRTSSAQRGSQLNVNTAVQRRNWREIPEIVRFCDGIDAQVFFCYVCCPVAHALWSLPAAALGEIGDLYERTSLPEGTPPRLHNKRRFSELTGAVRAWHAAALARAGARGRLGGRTPPAPRPPARGRRAHRPDRRQVSHLHSHLILILGKQKGAVSPAHVGRRDSASTQLDSAKSLLVRQMIQILEFRLSQFSHRAYFDA